ncbi:MAG TPA: putative ABC exporter domain-containing protein [Tepidisphaeraceae bacterium]|jgi:hypothetical protein
MNPALFTLIRLQSRGFIRRITSGARSPRRAVFLVIGLVMIVLWLGPGLVTAIAVQQHHPGQRNAYPHRFRAIAPLALLGICVLTIVSSAGDKAIAFTPGEMDMLFPGPFSRRELLAYKLLKSAVINLLTALIVSLALLIYAHFWLACYVGVFLTLLFIQLFSTAGVLLGQAISQHAYSMVRRVILIAALILGAVVARNFVAAHGAMEAVYQFRYSDLGQNLLAPFDPLGRTITAFDADELVRAGGAAALIDAGLLVLVVLLDANYLEAATAASRRRYAQVQRIRSGSLLSAGVKGDVSWRLPAPPWLWGAGPIAWRQATSAARSARGLLIVLVLIAVCIGPLFGGALRAVDATQPLIGIIAWLTILLSGLLKFDFRGDLDHMEELKALPLEPAAMAVGQIIVPAIILTGAHVILLGSVAIATRTHLDWLAVAMGLAFPFNALLMATENTIFLLFPTRPAAASPGDFQMLGRQAAQLVMKAITVMIGLAIAVAVAVPIFILLGGPLVVLTLIAGIILLGETVALIPAIAWAFKRFDPSVDTPA